MRKFPTLVVAKIAGKLSRVLGRGDGSTLPGLIAEKLRPSLAVELAAELPKGVIVVTGTNGKTTTTKLINDALTASGEKVLTNRSGSNLRRGILSSLIKASSLHGRVVSTVAVFEVDEASLRLVAAELDPQHIVVLNLFRDQLDRYGEVSTTARLIAEGVAATKAHLHLNADDPLVVALSGAETESRAITYFGVSDSAIDAAPLTATADSDRCPACGHRLVFTRVFYSHLGHYECPRGDFKRPLPSVTVTDVLDSTVTGTTFTACINGDSHDFVLPLPGTYNVYNALAALALTSGFEVDVETVRNTLRSTRAAFGRVERFMIEDRTLSLLLVKNPAGFEQVIQTFLLQDATAPVLMAINDRHADGRDVSWLWDVQFECLAVGRPPVLTSGSRATEMALRLKYSGVATESAPQLALALRALIKQVPVGGSGYIAATYTAMLEVRAELNLITDVEKVEA